MTQSKQLAPLHVEQPSLYVLVKGSPDAALFAAWVRGIPAEAVEGMSRPGESMLRVPSTHRLAVYDWATEPGSVPYKVGACVGIYRGAA